VMVMPPPPQHPQPMPVPHLWGQAGVQPVHPGGQQAAAPAAAAEHAVQRAGPLAPPQGAAPIGAVHHVMAMVQGPRPRAPAPRSPVLCVDLTGDGDA
jgi:hypothetical protein